MVSIEQNIYLSVYENSLSKPENYNLESLFLSQIRDSINERLLDIKKNSINLFFTYENFVYKISYISYNYYFLFIDIRIFLKNGLYYCEVKKKDGRNEDFLEFYDIFINKKFDKYNLKISQHISENHIENLHALINNDIETKQNYSTLMKLFYGNEKHFQNFATFYSQKLKTENDWESTYFLTDILLKLTNKQNAKNHLSVMIEKAENLFDSTPNSRKKMVINHLSYSIISILSEYKEHFSGETEMLVEKTNSILDKIKFDFYIS